MTRQEILAVTGCVIVLFVVLGLLHQTVGRISQPNKTAPAQMNKAETPEQSGGDGEKGRADAQGGRLIVEQLSLEDETAQVQEMTQQVLHHLDRPGPIQPAPLIMNTDQKLRMVLRSVLRAAEAIPDQPWEKGYVDRRRALEEACAEARAVLRIIDNEEHLPPAAMGSPDHPDELSCTSPPPAVGETDESE